MNSIIPIHVASPQADTALDLGLRRLGLYVDDELDLLVEIAEAAKLRRASHALEALSGLHLAAGSTDRDTRRLLRTARRLVTTVLGEIRAMPAVSAICAPAGLEDFDARIAWAGARLQDIEATLSWALD